MHYLLTFILVLIISTAAAQVTEIRLPSDPPYPNGITSNSKGDLFIGYVGKPVIHQLNADTGETKTIFRNESLPGTTALRYDRKRGWLWAMIPPVGSIGFDPEDGLIWKESPTEMGVTRLIAINEGRVQREIEFPQGSFSNDLAFDQSGNIYVTDSRNPRIFKVEPDAAIVKIYAEARELGSDHVGLAGIDVHTDGSLIVGNFSEGTLHRITPDRRVKPILLQRKLSFPDGLIILNNGQIVVTEGATTGGSGKVTLVKFTEDENGNLQGSLLELAKDLDTPVNLTFSKNTIYATDARVRHLFEPSLYPRPEFFRIIKIQLDR